MSISIVKIRKLLFVIWVFFAIYLPPISKIATVILLGGIAWLYLICNYRFVYKLYNMKKILLLFISLLILCIYIIGIGFWYTGTVLNTAGSLLYLTLFILPTILSLGIERYKRNITIISFFKIIIAVGVIQGIIAILTYLFYDIQTFFVKPLYYIMSSDKIDFWRQRRLYGISSGMTFAMPIAQGTIGAGALLYGLKRDIRYILVVPIIWLGGILNARTAIVVILIGVVCVLLCFNLMNKKNWKILFVILICISVAAVILLKLITTVSNADSAKWVQNGIVELLALFHGEKIGYFSYIDISKNSGVFQIPEGIAKIFGVGQLKVQSDIGYIYDIWIGGILYCIALYLLYITLIYRLYKKIKIVDVKVARGVALFFFSVFMVTNIKGHIFGVNEFMILFLLCIVLTDFARSDKEMEGNKLCRKN